MTRHSPFRQRPAGQALADSEPVAVEQTDDPHPARRHFLAGLAATGAGTAAAPLLAQTAPAAEAPAAVAASPAAPRPSGPLIAAPTSPLMPRGKAQRVVVAGGGWGGLTVAKYLRKLSPDTEVVLLERNPVFFSCPISNKWLIDAVDTSFLIHDYLKVSQAHGYTMVQCEVLDIDRTSRKVVTSQGWLDYDYLVLAPGIRYNYDAWFKGDRQLAETTRARFPAAYVSNAEHFHLKKALHNFSGGDWVMTLPPPPQRCPPSPYERACMVAWWIKSHNIKGRVTILDHKDGVRPIGPGFRAAFSELYKDQITYVPNAHVQEIDPFNKRIKTSAGDMRFDHAVLMAPHQAGELAWKADAIGRTAEGQPTGWADVEPIKLHLKSDSRVYVIGDAVGFISPQFQFYPKSAHVANRHGRIVAAYIAERVAGREPKLALPDNLCYMMVNGDPKEAISVQFDYTTNDKGQVIQTQIDVNERDSHLVEENLRWARLMFDDMFA